MDIIKFIEENTKLDYYLVQQFSLDTLKALLEKYTEELNNLNNKCNICNGNGFTIEVEAECCNCPTDIGECCNVPNPIQVQKQCCCVDGKLPI